MTHCLQLRSEFFIPSWWTWMIWQYCDPFPLIMMMSVKDIWLVIWLFLAEFIVLILMLAQLWGVFELPSWTTASQSIVMENPEFMAGLCSDSRVVPDELNQFPLSWGGQFGSSFCCSTSHYLEHLKQTPRSESWSQEHHWVSNQIGCVNKFHLVLI